MVLACFLTPSIIDPMRVTRESLRGGVQEGGGFPKASGTVRNRRARNYPPLPPPEGFHRFTNENNFQDPAACAAKHVGAASFACMLLSGLNVSMATF